MTEQEPAAGYGRIRGPQDLWLALTRRLWLVLGLPVLVLAVSVATDSQPDAVYQAQLSFAVDVPTAALVPGSDEGTAAKIGEALIDDLSRIISGDVFAAAVAARLPEDVVVRSGQVASSLSATDRHRIADVTVTGSLPADSTQAEIERLRWELAAIAEAAVQELEENGGQWFARLGEEEIRLTVISRPAIVELPPPLRFRLEIPLRLGLATAVAIAAALAWYLLDDRLYRPSEASAAAGAPLIGKVPTKRRGLARFVRR